MAKTLRKFQDLISGTTNATLSSGGTSLSGAFLANLMVIADPNFIALTLDPEAENGDPEIVHVISHGNGATTATIQRAQEGTSAREHASGTKVIASITADALEELQTPVGVIKMHSGTTAPTGWLLCDGAEYARTSYPLLNAHLSALGYPFGNGNGSTTFNVPNFNDRHPIGIGAQVSLGETGGEFDHTHTGPLHSHTVGNHTHTIPSHTHTVSNHTHTFSGSFTTSSAGDHAHSNPNTAVASGTAEFGAGSGFLAAAPDHVHVQGNTSTTGAHTHTGSVSGTTGSGGSGNTGSGGSGNTGSAGAGSTSSDGDGPTGAANAPFLGVTFIIKAA